MAKATVEFTLKVEYLYCSKCEKRPINFSQKNVDRFIKQHKSHGTPFNQYLTLVGYDKKQKLTVRFVTDQKPKKVVYCHYKKCENYHKGFGDFCSKKCKKKHKHDKRRK